jgi:hypothetical protein
MTQSPCRFCSSFSPFASSRSHGGTGPAVGRRHRLATALGLLAACLTAVVLPRADAAPAVETEPGATVPPPGVILDTDAAPLAPDPESLYIRLLAADGDAARRETVAGEDGNELTLEQASPATANRSRDAADDTEARTRSRTVAAPGEMPSTRADVGPADAGVSREAKDREAKKNPCSEASEECREALKRLRDDAISDIALDIRIGGRPGSDYPCECRLEGETFKPRRFATTMMTWKAAGYCHKPLYFEDWSLERYGHSHGPLADPFFSAAHFFVTLPVLPYKMGVELPWECVYPLGYYRPGSCAPWTIPAVPISCRGFAVQAATVTGIIFALP